jgi:hypothetical protein
MERRDDAVIDEDNLRRREAPGKRAILDQRFPSQARVSLALAVAIVTVGIASVSIAQVSPPAPSNEAIAKAYVQALTGGAGSKAAGPINFAALGCTPQKAFDKNTCERPVKDGKDGKTFLMQSITASNISALVPAEDIKRVFKDFNDPKYSAARQMLIDLSAGDDGFFPNLDGNGKAKAILQAQLESIGAGGMYGWFVWPFDTVPPEQAKMTAAGVSIRFNTLPSKEELDQTMVDLYFWALNPDISDMAYPPGFSALPPNGGKDCRRTTTAWGHVGFQYPKDGTKHANWGGGGNGSGVDDYGCGGSDVSNVPFDVGVWYEYRVTRGDRLAPKLWKWLGEIYNKSTGERIYSKSIFGGEYITGVSTWIEPIGIVCTDPKVSSEWKEPWYGNRDSNNRLQIFRVGRVSLDMPNDVCLRTREDIVSTCAAEWRQDMGAIWPKAAGGALLPPSQAKLAELRAPINHTQLEEQPCGRPPDPSEAAIARAYVSAISSGQMARLVPGAVDYNSLGCNPNAVWDEKKCQTAVFNGQDGKTLLMNAITPAAGGDWRTSNIRSLIPEPAMRRIMTDPRLAQAKEMFGNMSAPGNGWYDGSEKLRQAKDVLHQYMSSVH